MSENTFLDALCNTCDGVYIVDSNRHIVRWNKASEKLLKYAENDVLNHDCFRVIAGRVSADKPWCGPNCKIYANALKGSPQKDFDMWTQARDGEPLWLNVSILSPPASDEPYVVHIFRDVTRAKRTELALDQFLAHLSGNRADEAPIAEGQDKDLAGSDSTVKDRMPATLSSREIEVLTLLAEGLPTKSLAQKLNISHFTARNHIQNILVKLDLHSKSQAVSYAFRRGIL
jgi:PAS domain S-box-containing protein